jgi:hypothetical protein
MVKKIYVKENFSRDKKRNSVKNKTDRVLMELIIRKGQNRKKDRWDRYKLNNPSLSNRGGLAFREGITVNLDKGHSGGFGVGSTGGGQKLDSGGSLRISRQKSRLGGISNVLANLADGKGRGNPKLKKVESGVKKIWKKYKLRFRKTGPAAY